MTQRSKTLSVVALAAAAGLALAGCGKSDTGSPNTTAQSTTAAASASATSTATTSTHSALSQWDPCTIPDSAVSGLGLDATTKSNQVAGTTFDGWKLCGWKAADDTYRFEISTSSHTLNDYKQRTDYTGFTPTTLGNHQGLQYQAAGATHDIDCSISAQTAGGTVDFEVINRYGKVGVADPCTTVRRLADGLTQYLPGA
jgi:hypothetical protein